MSHERPNLFLLGAPKCGTTTVAHLLATTGVVHFKVKESGFFCSNRQWSRGWNYAQSQFGFETTLPFSLEATPWTLYLRTAQERILEACGPEVLTVAVLRDPLERSIAMYYDQVARGFERRTLNEAFEAELKEDWADFHPTDLDRRLISSYLKCSQYQRWLSAAKEHFPLLQVWSVDDLAEAERAWSLISELVGTEPPSEASVPRANARTSRRSPLAPLLAGAASRLPDPVRRQVRSAPGLLRALEKAASILTISQGGRDLVPTLDASLASEATRRLTPLGDERAEEL